MSQTSSPNDADSHHLLLAYIADLELEVDRLQQRYELIRREADTFLKKLRPVEEQAFEQDSTGRGQLETVARQFGEFLQDLREPLSYHHLHDQVLTTPLRPLIEQVFRWQQRLLDAPRIVLRLELESDSIEWFPSRLRHILDNLISTAIRNRDRDKGESRLTLTLRVLSSAYELRLSDNGAGFALAQETDSLQSSQLIQKSRAGLWLGLAVAKLLLEQSGGTLVTDSNDGQGASVVAILPRFDVDDFLENSSTHLVP